MACGAPRPGWPSPSVRSSGGFLLEHYSWSSIFYTLGPVSLAVIALAARFVPGSKDPVPHGLDFPGLVLSSGFMGLLVYTIIEAPGRGWTSAASLLGFAGAAAALIAFIVGERRTDRPMLDVRLFANMRFSAASASVTVAFFTLSGFIFLMTQYFQFVRSYSPLSAGVHLLPVAVSVAVGSIAGTRLAVRLGTKIIVTAGLALQAGFYFWVASDITPTFSYGIIAIQMVVYGLGMGLTSAPATESIMGAVSARQAGVGSAVNDSTRLLGGTLGVAVIGSVYASLYASRLTASLPATLPHTLTDLARQSVGAAFGVSGQLAAHGQSAAAAAVRQAATSAFDHGLSVGCVVAAAIALAGALLAAAFLPAQPPQVPGPEHHPAELPRPQATKRTSCDDLRRNDCRPDDRPAPERTSRPGPVVRRCAGQPRPVPHRRRRRHRPAHRQPRAHRGRPGPGHRLGLGGPARQIGSLEIWRGAFTSNVG